MSEREKREFQRGERIAQRHADAFYGRRGYIVADRRGCRQWDVRLKVRGNLIAVEEKFRVGLHWNDLLIEIVQDLRTGALGWAYETRCEWLHYFLCDSDWTPRILYQGHWPQFKEWLGDYMAAGNRLNWVKSTRGWGTTLNLAVPLAVIPLGSFMRHDLDAL